MKFLPGKNTHRTSRIKEMARLNTKPRWDFEKENYEKLKRVKGTKSQLDQIWIWMYLAGESQLTQDFLKEVIEKGAHGYNNFRSYIRISIFVWMTLYDGSPKRRVFFHHETRNIEYFCINTPISEIQSLNLDNLRDIVAYIDIDTQKALHPYWKDGTFMRRAKICSNIARASWIQYKKNQDLRNIVKALVAQYDIDDLEELDVSKLTNYLDSFYKFEYHSYSSDRIYRDIFCLLEDKEALVDFVRHICVAYETLDKLYSFFSKGNIAKWAEYADRYSLIELALYLASHTDDDLDCLSDRFYMAMIYSVVMEKHGYVYFGAPGSIGEFTPHSELKTDVNSFGYFVNELVGGVYTLETFTESENWQVVVNFSVLCRLDWCRSSNWQDEMSEFLDSTCFLTKLYVEIAYGSVGLSTEQLQMLKDVAAEKIEVYKRAHPVLLKLFSKQVREASSKFYELPSWKMMETYYGLTDCDGNYDGDKILVDLIFSS